ncbi:hypothetical protein DL98DRAFT_655407 [Cadophora sp. DSE1049]|nr:hypothetical protein DL98DRAFT_655407 [Cadophora sp. DSE1049]
MDITVDTPTDLELAQQGAQEAAQEISRASAERALCLIAEIHITPRPQGPFANFTSDGSSPLQTFHPLSRLPMELRYKILRYGLPPRRLVKISSDNYLVEVQNPLTGKESIETILRAKATMFISPLAGVSKETRGIASGGCYLTGFRLRYIRLYFDFVNDTLFIEDAKALVSLLGPIGDYERRDAEKEEHLVQAFDDNGPSNIVLAGSAESYEDLYSIIRHFAWVDTLIMEEPARSPRTPLRAVADREGEIRRQMEDHWKDRRGPKARLPLFRFLPAQNIELLRSAAISVDRGVAY